MLHGSLRNFKAALRHGIIFRVPPDDGDGEGGGGAGGGGGGRTDRKEKPVSVVVADLVRKHGDANTALGVLAGENLNYRRRHRDDRETIDKLNAKLPKEGGLVLTPEQAKDWQALQALGKPAEVIEKIEKLSVAEGRVSELERRELLREAAGLVGYKATVLEDRVKADGLHVEIKDMEVEDGKGGKTTKKAPYVRKADNEKATPVLVTEYATKNWADYLPSLKSNDNTSRSGGGTSGGLRLPANTQSATGGSGATNPLDRARERLANRSNSGNPLAPKVATESGK